MKTSLFPLYSPDATMASVQGQPPVLHQWMVQNNLAAVLIGGSERQQERVVLALSAGLPVQP